MEISERIRATLAAHFYHIYRSPINQGFPTRWRLSLKQPRNAMAEAQENPKLAVMKR
jgi:hypothetical protein